MEIFLLSLYAFLRPILSVQIGGVGSLELAAILLFVLVAAVLAMTLATRRDVGVSALDLWMVAFTLWCVAVVLIYPDHSQFREAARLFIPFLGYIVAGKVLSQIDDYKRILRYMLLGFAAPVLLSAGLILSGGGVHGIQYWTGVPRWEGIYDGAHTLGHNMLFVLFVIAVYTTIHRASAADRKLHLPGWEKLLLAAMVIGAVYAMAMSQLRTAFVGFAIFAVGFGFVYYRRAFFLCLGLAALAGVAVFPKIAPVVFHDAYYVMEGKGTEDNIASGRPKIWGGHLKLFLSAPLDQQIAGVGIGNRELLAKANPLRVSSSHSDWLELTVQTGVIGVLLYLAIQFLLFRRILRIEGYERQVFLWLFVSVTVMNLVSNSYVVRFALAQLYYLVMAYVALDGRRQQSAVMTEPAGNEPRAEIKPLPLGAGVRPFAKANLRR